MPDQAPGVEWPTSMPTAGDVSHLPMDVLHLVIIEVILAEDNATILKLMLCSKYLYRRLHKTLYRLVRIDAHNHQAVFRGLDHSLVSKESLDLSSRTHESLEFGLDPIAVHRRKLGLLNSVKYLIVVDFAAAEAIKDALNLDFWQTLFETRRLRDGRPPEDPAHLAEMYSEARPFLNLEAVYVDPHLQAECTERGRSNTVEVDFITSVTMDSLKFLAHRRPTENAKLCILPESSVPPTPWRLLRWKKRLSNPAWWLCLGLQLLGWWLLFKLLVLPLWWLSKFTVKATLSFVSKVVRLFA